MSTLARIQHKPLTILTISGNTNSFGLHGVILIDQQSQQGYEVGANALWVRDRAAGQTLHLPIDTIMDVWHWEVLGIEIPRSLGKAPQALLDKAKELSTKYAQKSA